MISAFTADEESDPLIKYLMLTNAGRKRATVPLEAKYG
jgi:hypothetical protein